MFQLLVHPYRETHRVAKFHPRTKEQLLSPKRFISTVRVSAEPDTFIATNPLNDTEHIVLKLENRGTADSTSGAMEIKTVHKVQRPKVPKNKTELFVQEIDGENWWVTKEAARYHKK